MLQHGNSLHMCRTGETQPTCVPWLLHISHCRTGETLPTQSQHVDAFRSPYRHRMCRFQPLCISSRAADRDGSQTGVRAVRCAWVRWGRGAWAERVREAAAPPLHLASSYLLISSCLCGLNGKRESTCNHLILSCELNLCGAFSLKPLTYPVGQIYTSVVGIWRGLHLHTGYQP